MELDARKNKKHRYVHLNARQNDIITGWGQQRETIPLYFPRYAYTVSIITAEAKVKQCRIIAQKL